MTKEKEQVINKVKEIDEGYSNFMFTLYQRWMEEKDYEDFNDYANQIKKVIKDIKITKVTKRPFGIKYDLLNYTIHSKVSKRGNYLCFSHKISKKVV